MAFERTYKMVCDACGKVHNEKLFGGYSTPRRARAAAKHDGWQRCRVVVGQYEGDEWGEDSMGRYGRTGRKKMYDEHAGRDFCPQCLDAMDEVKE